MATFRKLVLAGALGGAALLAGCATGPYYDNYGYGYDRGYDSGYYGYDSGYAAPSVGLGFTYSDRDRNWRDNDGRWRDNDGRWRDRGDRSEWRGSRDSRTSEDRRSLYDPNTNVYRGVGPDYDPKKDNGQYSGG